MIFRNFSHHQKSKTFRLKVLKDFLNKSQIDIETVNQIENYYFYWQNYIPGYSNCNSTFAGFKVLVEHISKFALNLDLPRTLLPKSFAWYQRQATKACVIISIQNVLCKLCWITWTQHKKNITISTSWTTILSKA